MIVFKMDFVAGRPQAVSIADMVVTVEMPKNREREERTVGSFPVS